MGKQRLLNEKIQPPGGVGVGHQIVGQRSQGRAHGPADLHLLTVLLGADAHPLLPQVVLLRVSLGPVQLLLHLLFGGADLPQLRRGGVGDVEAPAAGVFRVQDGQGRRRIVEGKARQARRVPQLFKQGAQGLQPLEIALQLEQLHMVRHLQLPAPAQGAADVLHLAQHHADLVIQVLQLPGVGGGPLHVAQLLLQLLPLVRGIVPQAADALLAEGTAPVQALQDVLQADLLSLLKTNLDHASSSFTLMTGTSTASFIRAMNSSLSNFHP